MEEENKVIVEVAAAPFSSIEEGKQTKKLLLSLWVEDVYKWAPFQLPVTSSHSQGTTKKKKKKKKQSRFPMPLLLSVRGVLAWALLAAGIVAVAVVVSTAMVSADIHIHIPGDETSKIHQGPQLTPAQEVKVESFGEGFLWLTVPQVAAATVGLLLPRRHARGRWSLAFLAIVSATAAHYMVARMLLVFTAANPGYKSTKILACVDTVFFLAGDLLSLISLVLMGAAE